MEKAVVYTKLGDREPDFRGKVRDIYDLGDYYLIVATDRVSAFDHILPTPIPGRGKVLTKLSVFWFQVTERIVKNHLVFYKIEDYPEYLQEYREQLEGRSMLVRKAERIDIECVVRGYLAGSGWKEYQKTGKICGIELPPGLHESDRLPEPIFTPATKAPEGEHDINITFEQMAELVGEETANFLRETSLEIYKFAHQYALERGIIIADTKFEFGRFGDDIILIDELLTPDSSRFWDASAYKPGKHQESFDKQFIRDYLLSVGWRGEGDPPELPPEVVEQTIARYEMVAEMLMRG